MFSQLDKRLNPIGEWGCYFCALCRAAEVAAGREFENPARILEVWAKNAAEGDLDYESFIKDPQGVLDDLPGGLEFVGWRGVDYAAGPGEMRILRWHNPRTGFYHFTFEDPRLGGWDPIPGSTTARDGVVVDMRIVRRRGV